MKRQMASIGLSMLVGVLVSFLLLFLGISGIEAAWSLQMLGMWIGAALGFSVHGPLYLVGASINAALYGGFFWLAFWGDETSVAETEVFGVNAGRGPMPPGRLRILSK